jgi:hypothetical protein
MMASLKRTLVLLYRRHFEHYVLGDRASGRGGPGASRPRPTPSGSTPGHRLPGPHRLHQAHRGARRPGPRPSWPAGWSRSSTSSPTATSCTGCTVRRQVRCRSGRRRESAATPAADAEGTAAARLPGPRRGTRLLAYGVEPSCIACMFFSMTASAVRSSSLGAEPHELGAGLVLHRDVAGRRVEGVAGLEHLITVGVPSGHLALEDIAPMRARAAVVRKPLHQGRRVEVFEDRCEAHGVAVELAAQIHHRASLLALWRAVS